MLALTLALLNSECENTNRVRGYFLDMFTDIHIELIHIERITASWLALLMPEFGWCLKC